MKEVSLYYIYFRTLYMQMGCVQVAIFFVQTHTHYNTSMTASAAPVCSSIYKLYFFIYR